MLSQISKQLFKHRVLYNNDLKLLISAHCDNRIRFSDPNSGKVTKTLLAHTDAVTDLCLFQKNLYHMASVSHDGSMRTWDIRKYHCLHEIPVRNVPRPRLIQRSTTKVSIQFKTTTISWQQEVQMESLRFSITLMSFEHYLYITQIKFTVQPIASNLAFSSFASSAFIPLLKTAGAFSTKSLASFSPRLKI